MRGPRALLAALVMLSACSSGDVAGDSDELEIQNAAKIIDETADAEANRIIADIEATAPKNDADVAAGDNQKEN